MTDTLSLVVTREQAERLLALVDQENAATKNRLVSAVLSDSDYADYAVPLAETSQALLTLRANIQSRLNGSLAR